MKYEKFLILTFLFLICLFSACEKKTTEKIPAKFESSKDLSSYSKIEDVDFRNFSYSYSYSLGSENGEVKFTLINGEKPLGMTDETGFRLHNIRYADLTNDGKNEVILNFYVAGAVSYSSAVFIYTLKNNQPEKLWHFFSGMYANGGLKTTLVKENNLVLELFGNTKFDENKNEFLFPNIQKYPEAECCPSKFTRFYFNWNGEKFALAGEPKLFDYDWKKERNENLFYREESLE